MDKIDFRNKEFLINNYRIKKFGEEFLVTTDHGKWVFLNKNHLELLKNEDLDLKSELFKELEEKGIILTKKNLENIKKSLRERYSFLYSGPSLHIVVPTLRCNQKCVYCHASSKNCNLKNFDMNETTAKKIVDFIFQAPSKNIDIEFQGGEPLLNLKIIKFIVNYSNELNKRHKKNLRFLLVTNLTLMNQEILDYLIKNKIEICTSLDGPERLHNKNRGYYNNKGSYEYVKYWITKIKQEYQQRKLKRNISALVTITKESLKYPTEIIEEYLKSGHNHIHLRFLNNLGDARSSWKSISYSSEEFIEFWKKSINHILELNEKGIFFSERTCNIILQKILTNIDPSYTEMRSPCGAVLGQLAYDYNGDIYTCDEARMVGDDLFKLGNVNNHNNFKEITSSEQSCSIISASTNDCQICDYCAYKPFCGLCPVCNYSEQGNILAKIPETSRCKIYKEQFTYIFEKLKDTKTRKILESWINIKE